MAEGQIPGVDFQTAIRPTFQRMDRRCEQIGDTRPEGLAEPLFFGSEIYRGSSYGPRHPLRVPRVSTVMDLPARSAGWGPRNTAAARAPSLPR